MHYLVRFVNRTKPGTALIEIALAGEPCALFISRENILISHRMIKKTFIARFLHSPRNTTNNRGIAIPTCNSFGSNSAVAFLLEASAFDMFHPSNHACLAEAHCEPLLRISFGNLCTFDYLGRYYVYQIKVYMVYLSRIINKTSF